MVTGIPCPEYRYKPVWGNSGFIATFYKAIMAIPEYGVVYDLIFGRDM